MTHAVANHRPFVEPGFLFAFSAHKAHLGFAPTAGALAAFRNELEAHETTKGTLQVRYDQPLPETLIRQIAEHCAVRSPRVKTMPSGEHLAL